LVTCNAAFGDTAGFGDTAVCVQHIRPTCLLGYNKDIKTSSE